MKKRSIRTILPALLLTSALVLGGCGASGGSSSANYAKGDYAVATEAPAESYDGGYYAEEAYESGFDEELAEAEAAAYGENEKASRGEKADQGEDVKAAKSEEKLVYTCSINMETLTFAKQRSGSLLQSTRGPFPASPPVTATTAGTTRTADPAPRAST